MSSVLTAAQIETAAQQGRKELALAYGTVVTPLARDRAVALGVVLIPTADPGASGASGALPSSQGKAAGRRVARLVLESRVRILARRALLRQGAGLTRLEDVVASVLQRLSEEGEADCRCEGERA